MNLLPLFKEKIADQISLARAYPLEKDKYFNGAMALLDLADEALNDADSNELSIFVKDYQAKKGL